MSVRLPTFCCDCGAPLRKENPTDRCAECTWNQRNDRLLAAEREHERQRRRQAVSRAIAQLDNNNTQGAKP
jgi:hypothetical protein